MIPEELWADDGDTVSDEMRKMIADGLLEATRFGGKWYYRLTDKGLRYCEERFGKDG